MGPAFIISVLVVLVIGSGPNRQQGSRTGVKPGMIPRVCWGVQSHRFAGHHVVEDFMAATKTPTSGRDGRGVTVTTGHRSTKLVSIQGAQNSSQRPWVSN